jgi:hypothetical protein
MRSERNRLHGQFICKMDSVDDYAVVGIHLNLFTHFNGLGLSIGRIYGETKRPSLAVSGGACECSQLSPRSGEMVVFPTGFYLTKTLSRYVNTDESGRNLAIKARKGGRRF